VSKQQSEAAKAYRGSHVLVTTGNVRNVTISMTVEQFARLDARAREQNVTRTALARNIVMRALMIGEVDRD
jgi:hypothetical protein